MHFVLFQVLATLISAAPTAMAQNNNLAQSTTESPINGTTTVDNSVNSLSLTNNSAGRDQVNVAQQNSGEGQTVIGYQHNSNDTYNLNQTNFNNFQYNVTNEYNQAYNRIERTTQNIYQITQAVAAAAEAAASPSQAQGYAQQQPSTAPAAQQASAAPVYLGGGSGGSGGSVGRPSNQDILAMIMHAKATSDAAFQMAMQMYQ